MLSKMAPSTTYIFSRVLLRRNCSSGHWHVTFISTKKEGMLCICLLGRCISNKSKGYFIYVNNK